MMVGPYRGQYAGAGMVTLYGAVHDAGAAMVVAVEVRGLATVAAAACAMTGAALVCAGAARGACACACCGGGGALNGHSHEETPVAVL